MAVRWHPPVKELREKIIKRHYRPLSSVTRPIRPSKPPSVGGVTR